MRTLRVRSGSKAEIVAIVEDSGRCPVAEFLERLSDADRRKVFLLFELFCQVGEIRNTEKFRKEIAKIWCFKSYQVRVFCFFQPAAPRRRLVLTHGVKKKQDRMPKAELERAQRYYNNFIVEMKR